MTLDEITTLVAEAEVMDIINNSLKSEQPRVPQVYQGTKGQGGCHAGPRGEASEASEEEKYGGEAKEETPR